MVYRLKIRVELTEIPGLPVKAFLVVSDDHGEIIKVAYKDEGAATAAANRIGAMVDRVVQAQYRVIANQVGMLAGQLSAMAMTGSARLVLELSNQYHHVANATGRGMGYETRFSDN